MENEAKVALVTGAAGIIGKSIAVGLLEDGYRVALADLNFDVISQVSEELGPKTYPVSIDVSSYESCKAGVEKVHREFGTILVLVNNAGILSNAKLANTTPDEWHRVMSVNLDGAFYLSQLCVPGMKEQKWGRIINMSSFAAKSGGITAGTAYSVSKAALVGLTFSIAAETTKTGITVNGIAPAYVRTPMVEQQLTPEQQAAVKERIPVGRYCEPEEVAHTVRFLASPHAGFITGEIIDQNGGFQFD